MREDDPKTCKNPIVLLTMIQTLSDDFEDVQIISKAQFEELVKYQLLIMRAQFA